jgi:hypothetical protein
MTIGFCDIVPFILGTRNIIKAQNLFYLLVGQHARMNRITRRVNMQELISVTPNTGVGHHARMVGHHKQERWVNMLRNLQMTMFTFVILLFDKLNFIL